MYHETLNQAIEAAGVDCGLWPISFNLNYGEIGRVASNGTFISVTRFEDGRYETAITYSTQCDDFQQTIKKYRRII